MLLNVNLKLLLGDFGTVLSAHYHSMNPFGNPVRILHSDLRLAVRSQVRKQPLFSDYAQSLAQGVSQGDRQRHQLGRFCAGEAHHHALVASAQLLYFIAGRGVAACLQGMAHRLRDIL